MADEEIIGGVGITVGADFSQLEQDFANAITEAQSESQKLAAAIQDGVTAPDISAAVGAFDQVGQAATDAGQAISTALSVDVQPPDLSPITDSLAGLGGAAQEASASVASALSDIGSAASAADAPIATLADQIQQLYDTGQASSLSEAMAIIQQLGEAAGAAAGGVDQLGNATASAGEQLNLFDQALASIPVAEETGQLNLFAGELEIVASDCMSAAQNFYTLGESITSIGPETEQAASGLKTFSDAAQSVINEQKQAEDAFAQSLSVLGELRQAYADGEISASTLARAEQDVQQAFSAATPAIQSTDDAAKAATESFNALNQAAGLLGVSLSALGLVKFAESVGEASDSLTKADIVLTRLTGDATQAADIIRRLEQLGLQDGLAFPQLEKAASTLEAMRVPGMDVVGILSQLADAGEASGKGIDAASQALYRLVEGGNVSAKTLLPLRITMDDLKAAMDDTGASAIAFGDTTQKAFKSLDEQSRLAVVSDALQKFKGLAEDVANNTLEGSWHKAAAQFDEDVAIITRDLGSLSDKSASLASFLKSMVNDVAVVFTAIAGYVKAAVDDIVNNVVALQSQLSAIGKAAGDALSGNIKQAAKDLSDGFAVAAAASKKATDDWNANIATTQKTIHDLLNQTSEDIKTTVPKLGSGFPDVAKAAKDMAVQIGAAFNDVATFEEKLGDAKSISSLQSAFENVSKAIDLVAKESIPAAITAVDEYTKKELELGAGAPVIQQAFEKMSSIIDKLAKVDLQGAIDAWDRYLRTLENGKAPIGVINEAVEKEEALIQKLVKEDYQAAEDKWQELIKTLQAGGDQYGILNKVLQDHQKFVDDNSAALDKNIDKQIKFVEQISRTALGIPSADKAIADMNDALDRMGIGFGALPPKISPLNDAMINLGVNLKKPKDALEDLKTSIDSITGWLDKLAAEARNTGDWSAYEIAIENVNKRIQELSKTNLPEAVSEMESVVQEMIRMHAPADMVATEMQKLGQYLKKMADENLPGAQAAWERYLALLKQVPGAVKDIQASEERQLELDSRILASMQARGDAYGYILQQQGKVLQEEISIAEKTGTDANQMVQSLEAVRLKYQALADASHGYGDAAVQAAKDIMSGFNQLSGAMAQAIIDGKNVGDALIGVFKNIAKSILTDLIQAALLPLKIAIENMLAALLGLPPVGAAVAAQVAGSLQVVNTAAGSAATGLNALAEAATNAAATINASAGADGAGGKGGGGALGTAGAIAQIAAVGIGIAQIVFLSHISSDTGHIEVNTREAVAELGNIRKDAWDQYNQTYDRIGELKNDLDNIRDTLLQMLKAGAGGGFPQEALEDLTDIRKAAQQSYVTLPSILGAEGTIASDIVTWGGYIMSDLDVLVREMGQLLTAVQTGSGAMQQAMDHMATGEDISTASQDITQAEADAAGKISDGIESSTEEIVQAGSTDAQTIIGSGLVPLGAAITGPIVDSIDRGAAEAMASDAAALAAAQRAAASATNLTDQIAALQREIAADNALMNDAIKNGDLALAEQYRQAAANAESEMLQQIKWQQDTASAANKLATGTPSQLGNIAAHVDAGPPLIVSAVQQSASLVVAAVDTAAKVIAGAVASVQPGTPVKTPAPGGPGVGPNSPTYTGPSMTDSASPTGVLPGGGSGTASTQYNPGTNAASGIPAPAGPPKPISSNPLPSSEPIQYDQNGNPVGGYTKPTPYTGPPVYTPQGSPTPAPPTATPPAPAPAPPEPVRPGPPLAPIGGGARPPYAGTQTGDTGTPSTPVPAPVSAPAPTVVPPPAPYPTPTGSGSQPPATTSGGTSTAPAGAMSAYEQQVLSLLTAISTAELEDIRNTLHSERDLIGSMRDGLVKGLSESAIIGKALLDQLGAMDIDIVTALGGKPAAHAAPKFQHGGIVPMDMLAHVDAGEMVLPPDISGALQRMISSPSYQGGPPAQRESSGGRPMVMNLTANFYGVTNAREQAQQFTEHLLTMVPGGGAYSV